jgi:hypothetical protein
MGQDENRIVLGIFILALALFVWKTTASLLGWLALFVPGMFYVLWGLMGVFR